LGQTLPQHDVGRGGDTVVRHSSEKGAIIILAIFFTLNSNFNLYNDVFEGKNKFKGQMGIIGILNKKL
jgi:hypothetical protein